MKIGNLKLKNRFFLAPMEGINDIIFRSLCKKAGAGLTYSPMIHPQSQQKLFLDDKPALQLFSCNEKGIKSFMKKHDKKVSLWDFNLGCPAKTAKKHRFGSFLDDLQKIESILKTMRDSTKKPVTIKIRKSRIAFDILKIAEKYCDAVTIHPRTQSQGYSGEPDIQFAEQIKNKTKLPVIYSGNVNEANARHLLNKFDFVMIGRKAIGNPGIFSRLLNKKSRIDFNDYLEMLDKYPLYFRQIKLQAMNFTKGKKQAKQIRLKLYKAKNLEEIKEAYMHSK